MIEILSYSFIQKALWMAFAIALSCGLIGPFLVLRKLSLLGDGLAHLAFGGVALGFWLGVPPLWASLITVVVGSLWVNSLIKKNVYGDAAIALLLSLGVGLGIVVIGATKGFNNDLYSYLIGSLFTVSTSDLVVSYLLLALIILFFIFFYRDMFILTFNEELAYLSKTKMKVINGIFICLVAFLVVMSIRAVGILLVSALLVIPSLIALNLANSFKQTLWYSSIGALIAIFTGIIISYILDIPPSGAIVLLLFIGFLISTMKKSNV